MPSEYVRPKRRHRPDPPPITPGVWIGVWRVHRREVRVTDEYPHICHLPFLSWITGQQRTVWRGDCAACWADGWRPQLRPAEQVGR